MILFNILLLFNIQQCTRKQRILCTTLQLVQEKMLLCYYTHSLNFSLYWFSIVFQTFEGIKGMLLYQDQLYQNQLYQDNQNYIEETQIRSPVECWLVRALPSCSVDA
ncbi:Hypothetical_protein [Hexamita inflata]|uniref:Hypothetical_protein n=1 Tax=Hexamita inflata TaxID=28002 RepID=A0AA86TTB5_9EUKA|nr:Hypothetical protein HINF_LOCUS15869 [Hexamita inflata]